MPTENVERKLTAILSADVKGYSRLMGEDEVGTLRMLTAYREVTDTLIQHHRGRIVGTAGDSILAEFASTVDATQCGVDIQQALKSKNAELPPEKRMEFRIGINVGDVIVEGPQIYGDGVNIAARLEALAEGGGLCISGTVYDQVENKLSLGYEYLGEQRVKNIAKPVRVYRVQREEPRGVEPPRRGGFASQPSGPLQGLPLPDKPSLIVLPFVNMSNDPEQEYFSDGITEDITTDLSKISNLFVISRNSAFTYKGKATKAQDINREMGVHYVLEGSVRKAGERVRITAQLIDALEDRHLWAERYDRPLTDIFAVQDDVVQKIVTTLKIQLTLREQGFLVRKRTDNLEAYDYYLRGMASWLRYTKEANAQARQMFEQAVALDPQYAEAYTGLGWTFFLEWYMQWNPDPQNLERAFKLTQKAVALDDAIPLAHRILGLVYLMRARHERAIAEMERAVSIDPNSADDNVFLGLALAYAGRAEAGIELIEKGMRLNPRYPVQYESFLGHAYRMAGRYEEAIAACKKAVARIPNYLPAHIFLVASCSEVGQDAEAQAEVAEVLRISPSFSVEAWAQRLPYKDPTAVGRFLGSLRKAGLK